MRSRNSLRKILAANASNTGRLDDPQFGPGPAAIFRFTIGLALCAIILTSAAAAQLSISPPMQNTQNVNAGATPTFTVIVSGGSGSPFLAWQFLSSGSSGPFVSLSDGPQASGSTISGSSTTTLVISNVQPGDAGKYRCLISNTMGGVTTNLNSGPGYLSVTTGLPFTVTAPYPTPQSAQAGTPVSFEADVSGQSGILNRSWQFSPSPANPTYVSLTDGLQASGSTIVGSALPILQIANAQGSDSGRYRQLVSDSVATPASALNSGPGNLTVTTLPPPSPPQNFQATAVSSGEIDLSWNNSDPTVTSYVVQRQAANGTYTQLATVPASTHSYNDVGLSPATQYTYSIYSQSATGNSSAVFASATTLSGPPAPTHINATAISPTQIDVSWQDPPAGSFSSIHVEQHPAEHPPFRDIGTVSASAPPVFHDQGLTPATTYFYQVRSQDAAGNFSAYSTLAITSTLVPVPTNLSSTVHTAPLIDLQWTNPFNGYTALHLYQNGPNDLVRFLVADLPGNATSYEFNVALPNTTYSFTLQAEVSGKLSAFTSDLVVTAIGKVTIFFVHGLGQAGGDLDSLARTVEASIDPDGLNYNFDSGFDWSRCTQSSRIPYPPVPLGEDGPVGPNNPPIPGAPNRCPNKCNVSDGAYDLASYIARQNPPGDVFIVAYSLGGNVARDMIEGQTGSGIGMPSRKLLGLVTLATPNNGYPYEYPWDNWGVCDGLGKEIASDIRTSPANYPYSPYIPSINTNWFASPLGGAGYQAFPWLVAAGTFCKSPIRFPDSTQNGCPAGSSNDGIVCTDSALIDDFPGGSFNRPTSTFSSDAYSHTAVNDFEAQLLGYLNGGNKSAFYGGNCDMRQYISIFDPPLGSTVAQQIANFIKANTP